MKIEKWKFIALCECIEQIIDFRGKTPKKIGMDWGGGNIKALSANNVKQGYIDFTRECYVASEALYDAWMTKGDCKKDDIIFTMEAPLGNVALLPDNNKYILSQRVILIKTNELVENKFLYHFMTSEQFQNQLLVNATGSTAKGIKQTRLIKLKVALPPKPEQQKIAEILSTVDKKIDLIDQKITETQQLKTGLMQKLFSEGVGVQDKEGNWVPHSDFNKNTHKPSLWTMNHFIKFFELQRGYDLPVQTRVHGSFPIIGSNGIVGYHNESRANCGVVTGRSGTLGKIYYCDIPHWPLNTSLYVKNYTDNDKLFCYYFLQNFNIARFGTGTGVPTLNRNIVHKQMISIPPLSEQQKIAEILSTVDQKLDLLSQQKAETQQLKKGLMQKLLTGEWRVPLVKMES
ncbi:restriction endonuclease subunit S [Gilliamella apicola]|uniref:restriction endonuclease subunit S n=1 Tax=Gilliamella apicola TaxID=1196095 RepID=UPI002FEE4ADD